VCLHAVVHSKVRVEVQEMHYRKRKWRKYVIVGGVRNFRVKWVGFKKRKLCIYTMTCSIIMSNGYYVKGLQLDAKMIKLCVCVCVWCGCSFEKVESVVSSITFKLAVFLCFIYKEFVFTIHDRQEDAFK